MLIVTLTTEKCCTILVTCLLAVTKYPMKSQKDGVLGNGSCWKAWWPKFNSQDPHGARRELTLASHPVNSTWVLWYMYPPSLNKCYKYLKHTLIRANLVKKGFIWVHSLSWWRSGNQELEADDHISCTVRKQRTMNSYAQPTFSFVFMLRC